MTKSLISCSRNIYWHSPCHLSKERCHKILFAPIFEGIKILMPQPPGGLVHAREARSTKKCEAVMSEVSDVNLATTLGSQLFPPLFVLLNDVHQVVFETLQIHS